jgi:hypothetical protein
VTNSAGATTRWAGGSVSFNDAAEFVNERNASVVVDCSGQQLIKDASSWFSRFTNQGRITKASAGVTTLSLGQLSNEGLIEATNGTSFQLGSFLNKGTVDIRGGAVTFFAGGANVGRINVMQRGSASFTGGQFDVRTGSTLEVNTGSTVRVSSGGQLNLLGSVTVQQQASNSSASAALAATTGGTIVIQDGDAKNFSQITSAGGTILFKSAKDLAIDRVVLTSGVVDSCCSSQSWPVLVQSGGTLQGRSNITVTQLWDWSAGRAIQSGSTVVTGALNITGTAQKEVITRAIKNAALVDWLDGDVTGSDNAKLINQATFRARANRTMSLFVQNQGDWLQQDSGVTSVYTGSFLNKGKLAVDTASTALVRSGGTHAGLMTTSKGGTIEFNNAGTLRFAPESYVAGSGVMRFSTGSTSILAGTYEISGNTSITGGTVNAIKGSQMLNMGTLDFVSGTLNFYCSNSRYTTNNHNTRFSHGKTLIVSCLF